MNIPDILDLDSWTPCEECAGHGFVGGCALADMDCDCGAEDEDEEFELCTSTVCGRCRGTGRLANEGAD
jgi:hypothetical protein